MNRLLVALLFSAVAVSARAQQVSTPTRELYRVHFFKAAPGKLPDLIDAYTTNLGTHPPLVFRHESGDDWDLLVIYPQGAKAAIDADPVYTDAQRKLRERVIGAYISHTDTYASGPPLAEVEKALQLPKGAKGGLYLIEDYTALNGHLARLDDVLRRDMASARSTGSLRFDHVQGAGWDFLVMFRYSSWQEYAAAETDPSSDELAKHQGFKDSAAVAFDLREHISTHHDTFAGRLQ